MTTKQLKQLEADLLERGYKKWTKCLVGREDYAYFKSFGLHKDKYGEDECDYQIAFRFFDYRGKYSYYEPHPQSEIWLTVTMIPSILNNRLDCDYSLQLDVPGIEMCEQLMAEIFETTKKYKL